MEQERIRLTISVPADVHEVFQRMAKASSMSISRAMGDWLGDTLEAAELTTTMIERARAAPKQVIRELNALALGYADETGSALQAMRGISGAAAHLTALGVAQGEPRAPEALRRDRSGASPPSSNTGGKVPQRGAGKGKRG